MKKTMILLVCAALFLAGCAKKEASGADGYVALKMYLLGDKSKDFDAVYAEINKILKEKVNASVEVSFLSWAEHAQKYSLLFSGGEDFDLIFTASGWAHYETTAAMGGFAPLSPEFLQKYAPDLYRTVPQTAWDQAKLDGKVYMVPNYANEFGTDVYALRGDLLKKYGYGDITSLDQLAEFFGKMAADQTKAAGISPLGNRGGMLYDYFSAAGYTPLNGSPGVELFIINSQNPADTKVTYLLDWELFEKYCRDMKNFFDRGFWSNDSLAATDQRQDGLLRGTSAGMAWNLGSCKRFAGEANAAHPDWEVTLVDYTPNLPKRVNPYINNGVAIPAHSKNKERAMMVLNEFYTNKAIYDLAAYGIEGVHWIAEGDKYYKTTPRTGDYGIGANCNWGWNNLNLTRTEFVETPTALDHKYDEILARWNENIKPVHPLEGFAFDKSNVITELAIVDSLIAEYYTPLTLGMAGDADSGIAALRGQLENAGIQRVIAEIDRQVEAYLAGKR